MTMRHVLLFDIDGTLINTHGAGIGSLKAALTSAFGIAEPTDEVVVHGRTDRGITRDYFRHHAIEDSPAHWERFRDAYLEHLPRLLIEKPGRVLSGVPELLDRLTTRSDVVLGLLTGNTRAGARIKLGHYGLADYFVCGGFGDEHPLRDDVAHEALRSAREYVGEPVDLRRVWVLGDTPADVRCARAIGARAIAVATGHHTPSELEATRPDALLSSLATFDQLLED